MGSGDGGSKEWGCTLKLGSVINHVTLKLGSVIDPVTLKLSNVIDHVILKVATGMHSLVITMTRIKFKHLELPSQF